MEAKAGLVFIAALSSAFSQRPSRFLAEGAWTREGNRITVDFNDRKRIVSWDRGAWGENGPDVLFRVNR